MSVKVGIVKLTPAKARRLLEEHNTHNRDLDGSRIEQYAADIRAGDWEINGEAVKIADDGTLLDGQHRLWGCVEAEKPFTTILVTGLSRSSQESMDQGRPRGFHDALKLRGEGNPNVLARTVRVVTMYERDGVPYLGGFGRHTPSNHECFRTLDRNPEIRDTVKWATNLSKRYFLPISLIAAMHHLFSAANETDSEAFFETLVTGDTDDIADQPILLLRRVLLADYEDPERRLHMRIKTAFIILAWDAWREGRELDELRWTPEEDFPPIHGLVTQALAA